MSKTKKQIELEYVTYIQHELGAALEESKVNITVVCENKEFRANSAVLKIGSPYFKALLNDVNEESNKNITVEGVDAAGMKTALNFLYWGKIETDDDDVEQMKSVLKASHILEIELLRAYCWQTLAGKLSDVYFVELWQLGLEHGKEKFVQSVISFIASNFTRASKSEDFVILSASQLGQVLKHSDMNALVDTIVTGLLRWAKEYSSEREGDLHTFLAMLDVSEMTNVALGQALKSDLVKKSRSLFDLFRPEVTARLSKTKSQRFFTGANLVCFRKRPKAVGEESVFSIYNIQKETWTQPKRLPVELNKDTVVLAHEEHIFFISRNSAEGDVMVIQKFSPAYNAITDSGYVRKVVFGSGAAAVKDKLYIVGGSKNANFVTPSLAVYCYNIQSRRYSEVSSLLEACIEPVVMHIDDYLFAVGRNNRHPSVLQQYSLIPNQWTRLRVLPELVSRCVVWGQKLYLILETETRFEVYDYKRDLWYTEEISGGPTYLTGLWYIVTTGKQKPMLLFRGDDFSLRCYNLSAAEWHSCRDSFWADDHCLSYSDLML